MHLQNEQNAESWFFLKLMAGKKILPGLKVAWQPSPYHWIISNINQNFTYHLKLIKLRFKIVKAKSEAKRQVKNVGSCNGDVGFYMMPTILMQ